MWPSLNAAYSLSVHSEAVLATFTTFQHHFNICTRNAGPALKQALHHSECFTHRNTNGSKSACGHLKKKNELWPTKAGTVGETLDASLMFSLQSQARVISLQPHSVHCTSPCEFVKNICQNEPNPNQCVKPPTAMETKWAKRAWRKLAYKLVLCGLWYL